ncbi:hypothetical protein GOV14_00805 [Candidatus Pacearchaeota archaeon]|nr:hypothetical protein [Candidatus Pacearchaeota archaeon]
MIKDYKQKKGELTIQQIVILILLLVGFAIVLLFLYLFGFDDQTKEQVCHQSVIYRSSVPIEGVIDLPLKCETDKICITTKLFGKGNCYDDFQGEKYITERVTKNEKRIDDEINKIIAKEMKKCWWMMGQGLVSVYEGSWKSATEKLDCNICTRIAFDKNLKAKRPKVYGYKTYLLTNKIDSGQTYWQFLTKSNSNYMEGYKAEEDFFETKEQTAIIYAEATKGKLQDLFPWGGGVGGAIVGGAIIGTMVPIPGATFIGAGIGGVLSFWGGDGAKKLVKKYYPGFDSDDVFTSIQFVPYNIETLENMECSSFQGEF